MKSEKLSTEIAALQRKQKETKNAVAKKALSSKIERLKKELDEITTSAQAKTALAKAQSKIREMSQKDFGEFVKKLAAKPEFSFLKGMSKSKIKDDIMRVAKPVGWRFRGRTNVKKPTKKDIQEGNNVYYEGRVNRSDVSRTVRLAEGGGVGRYYGGEYITDNDLMKLKNFEIVEKDRIRITPQSNEYGTRFGYDIEYLDENGKWEGSHSVSAYSKGEAFEKLKNKFQGKEYAKGGGVGDEMARGGEIVPYIIWVSRDGNKRELYGEYKSKRAAQMAMNKLWEKGEYNSIGNMPKSSYEKEGFYYAKGGKTDFGMLSVKAGIDNNPNPTYADKIAGATHKFANGGGVGEREKSIKNILKGKKYPLTPKELKDLSNKSGYSQGDIEYVFQKINNDLQYKVEYATGGGVGDVKVIKDQRGNTLYLTKIDSTHFFLSVNEGSKGNPYHIGQIKNEPYYNEVNEWLMSKYAEGGGVDMLHEDDFVWNASGKKLVVDKVTDDEYWLSGFMQPSASPFSKEKVHSYLKKGEWSLQPKMAEGGDVQSSEPHRLHMMAKGGMTFSESVLKEGLSDMLHHLYKAQNELDGIMGYLDRTGQGGMKSALKSKFGLNSISETTEKIDTYLDK